MNVPKNRIDNEIDISGAVETLLPRLYWIWLALWVLIYLTVYNLYGGNTVLVLFIADVALCGYTMIFGTKLLATKIVIYRDRMSTYSSELYREQNSADSPVASPEAIDAFMKKHAESLREIRGILAEVHKGNFVAFVWGMYKLRGLM